MPDPDNYQAYITVTIKNTANPPGVNEKRIEKTLNNTELLKAEGNEKVEFSFSDKEAA